MPDPCFQALLADPRNELRPPSSRVSLADLRAGNKAFLTQAPAAPLHAVEPAATAAANGIALRLYRPCADPTLPAVLFLHGGGFVLGDLDTHDAMCRTLAANSGAIVIAADYRRAPETPFPGPLEDCLQALQWMRTNAKRLGVDAHRIGVCGDSAGGNLAIATALQARDRHQPVQHLALLYPMIDPACTSASMQEFNAGFLLTPIALRWFWNSYLADPESVNDPRASVMQAALAGLPPTTLLTAEFDPLRDEGEAFAESLRAAGVNVAAKRYAGMIHGFAGMPQLTPAAALALEDIAAGMRAALAAPAGAQRKVP